MLAAEHALRGRERVDAVRLARAPITATRTLDLNDVLAGCLEVLAEAGAPAPDPLDAEYDLAARRPVARPSASFA